MVHHTGFEARPGGSPCPGENPGPHGHPCPGDQRWRPGGRQRGGRVPTQATTLQSPDRAPPAVGATLYAVIDTQETLPSDGGHGQELWIARGGWLGGGVLPGPTTGPTVSKGRRQARTDCRRCRLPQRGLVQFRGAPRGRVASLLAYGVPSSCDGSPWCCGPAPRGLPRRSPSCHQRRLGTKQHHGVREVDVAGTSLVPGALTR